MNTNLVWRATARENRLNLNQLVYIALVCTIYSTFWIQFNIQIYIRVCWKLERKSLIYSTFYKLCTHGVLHSEYLTPCVDFYIVEICRVSILFLIPLLFVPSCFTSHISTFRTCLLHNCFMMTSTIMTAVGSSGKYGTSN